MISRFLYSRKKSKEHPPASVAAECLLRWCIILLLIKEVTRNKAGSSWKLGQEALDFHVCVYIYLCTYAASPFLSHLLIAPFFYHLERRWVKDTSESMLQACCAVCDDAFQLALGVSFYSGTSELISGSMRLEDVLQGALERLFCSANKGVIWFAEICEQNPNQITTLRLNL